jgi:ribonuclease HI
MNKVDKIYSPEQTVTINCDASYHPKLKKGGWAFWISYSEGSLKHYGVFNKEIKDSTEAELKAICNAFHYVQKRFGESIKMIFVNCDNEFVRSTIKRRIHSEKYKTETDLLLNYTSKYELIIVKEIRGHQGSNNPRQFVNNWCDKYSRSYLKEKI